MEPRFPDIDPDALDATIETASAELALYPEVSDPRNYLAFHRRARARFARGHAAGDVVKDLRCAALCLRDQASVRLYKLDVRLLKSRRLDPVHLALLHPDPELVEAMGSDYGLPLTTWYAGAASYDLEREVRPMSGFFRTGVVGSPVDVVGLAAASYAAALGALTRGDENETAAVLRKLNYALERVDDEPPPSGKRYLIQCAALADMLGRREAELAQHLAALAPYARSDRERAMKADPEGARTRGEGAPDLVCPALVGLALLINLEIDLEPLRSVDPHLHALAVEVERGWEMVE